MKELFQEKGSFPFLGEEGIKCKEGIKNVQKKKKGTSPPTRQGLCDEATRQGKDGRQFKHVTIVRTIFIT